MFEAEAIQCLHDIVYVQSRAGHVVSIMYTDDMRAGQVSTATNQTGCNVPKQI